MRISDGSSDVCSSDLGRRHSAPPTRQVHGTGSRPMRPAKSRRSSSCANTEMRLSVKPDLRPQPCPCWQRSPTFFPPTHADRSEEHTSELQSLMRISYAVFCLKKKTHNSNRRVNISNYK